MTRLHDRVHVIHEAIRRGAGTKALFYLPRKPSDPASDYHWWACKTDSVRGGMMLRDFEQYLVGTFTPDVPFERLLEVMEFEERQRGVT